MDHTPSGRRGAPLAPISPEYARAVRRAWNDDELIALFDRIDNTGRWGDDDELGTLNYVTPEKRRQAASLVQDGRTLSLARPLVRGDALEHRLTYHHAPDNPLHAPPSAGEFLGLAVHQHGLTHLDCVSHVGSHEGRVYNGRDFDEIATDAGLAHGSVYVQREGIVSRGVLLDVAAARGTEWLEPGDAISVEDVAAAEELGGVRVTRGDVVVMRAGVEARAAVHGPSPLGPGPGPDLTLWLHEREVAVYAGDAPEHLTEAGARILGLLPPREGGPVTTRFPLPFHQLAIPAMGLVLLDYCRVEDLARACKESGRYEFLFVAAPLALPGGTGSPVNPIAIF
jgi:kynurenine formamidase